MIERSTFRCTAIYTRVQLYAPLYRYDILEYAHHFHLRPVPLPLSGSLSDSLSYSLSLTLSCVRTQVCGVCGARYESPDTRPPCARRATFDRGTSTQQQEQQQGWEYTGRRPKERCKERYKQPFKERCKERRKERLYERLGDSRACESGVPPPYPCVVETDGERLG